MAELPGGFSYKLQANQGNSYIGVSAHQESSLGGNLINPEFPYNKHHQLNSDGVPITTKATQLALYSPNSIPSGRPSKIEPAAKDISNLGSLKDTLNKNFKLIGPGMTSFSSFGDENHRHEEKTVPYGDDNSCFSDYRNQADDVNNMLNEASTFNCHQIQAANLDDS